MPCAVPGRRHRPDPVEHRGAGPGAGAPGAEELPRHTDALHRRRARVRRVQRRQRGRLGFLYAVTDAGVVTCFQAATGEIVYQGRLGGNYCASPVYADGRIYFLSESGETVVVAPGAEFKILARNPLGERCQASMAVSGGRLFIRTALSLYCIR
jgi:outer membrane protein assembly factor BamB